MTAMKASPGYVNNTYWYPDSGATNHVTSDLNNLTFGIECHGYNKIHMGNGEGLNISHFGHSVFSSLPFSSRILYLKNLLRVSLITKNPISVSQFSKDNNAFFEFHHDSCFVKDRVTGNYSYGEICIRDFINSTRQSSRLVMHLIIHPIFV